MANWSTKEKIQVWFEGGDEHQVGVCDSCGCKGPVAHIGYSEGSLGSFVFHCIECINAGRTLKHYEKTEFTPTLTQGACAVLKIPSPVGAAQVAGLDSEPESVVESKSKSNSAKSAQGVGMKDAKKGTKNAGKSNKGFVSADVIATSVSRQFHVDKVLDSGKVRFVPVTKEAEVSGSVYVLADIMPKRCKDAIITIEFKEA